MTDGRFGFDPSGRESIDTAHDPDATAQRRHDELVAAAAVLGIDELVEAAYHDSGMAGWPTNQVSEALAQRPLAELVEVVGRLIDASQSDLVVTYGPDGFYGHPDHLACHRAVDGAMALRPSVTALAPVVASGSLDMLSAHLRATGVRLPDWLGQGLVPGVARSEIAGSVSNVAFSRDKQTALGQHRSQHDNDLFAQLDDDAFFSVLGTEYYQVLYQGSDRSLALALSLLDNTSNLIPS
jgi:LmbE family N-acetylglucosaminyl deacetylase